MKKLTSKFQLKMLGLPVIESLDDFSAITHLSKGLIYNLSKNNIYYYKTYTKDKKGGGKREISQPSRKLKAVQAWILRNILDKLEVSPACKGFRKKASILDNAKPHIGANSILCIDLDNFFPSIKSNKVYTIFKTIGYNSIISTIFTNLCIFKGALPQGSPCSPQLSNLIGLSLDQRIEGFVGKRSITYTRYADDLTFSSYSSEVLLSAFRFIKKIIQDEQFIINNNKTRIAGPARARKVTGLIVTENSVGIGRKKLRELRLKIYKFWANEGNNIKEFKKIHGFLSFTKSVDKNRWLIIQKYMKTLNNKNPATLLCHIVK